MKSKFFILVCIGTLASVQAEIVMWYDRAADDYGLKSPLKAWEVESQKRTSKANPDQAW
jgi:hypothetical protein